MEPSLNAIRSFEAAAQHLSFTRAARQLGVQAPAVSRQVGELEQILGVRLFVRSKPRLALTRQGQELYHSVRLGLNEIRQGCNKIRNYKSDKTIRVITSIGIAHCWLLARLAGFYALHADIDLQLNTRDSTTDLDASGVDVAIAFGHGDMAGHEISHVFRETMIPVCHPKLLTRGELFSPAALASQPLLHYLEPQHRDDWRRLLGSAGVEAPAPGRGMTFNSYVVYLQAAINGAGIGVGWEHLLEDYLANGSLCRASGVRLETRRGYFCYLTDDGVDKPAARQFRDWVCGLVATIE
jgi:LysR family glycine cleavage system transcriptional activator